MVPSTILALSICILQVEQGPEEEQEDWGEVPALPRGVQEEGVEVLGPSGGVTILNVPSILLMCQIFSNHRNLELTMKFTVECIGTGRLLDLV